MSRRQVDRIITEANAEDELEDDLDDGDLDDRELALC
jgi:hypothetical protein